MYPCPCCGYLMFAEPPGSYDICGICFWEDDLVQLRWPLMNGGANAICLAEGQRNFLQCGAMEERFVRQVRPPAASDRRDAGWRPLDLAKDRFEHMQSGAPVDWPDDLEGDLTRLYYWRDTFWRR